MFILIYTVGGKSEVDEIFKGGGARYNRFGTSDI
jgi:hypothetical protein